MLSFEGGSPLFVDEPGDGIGKIRFGIAERFDPFGLEEERPARAEAAQHIVRLAQAATSSASVALSRSGPRKQKRPLKASVLVEHDAGCDEGRPRQMVGQTIGAIAVFGEVQHDQPCLLAKVTNEHRCEVGIALGGEDGEANGPAPTARARRSTSEDPDPSAAATVPLTMAMARGAPPKQDRLGQRAVQRHFEAFNVIGARRAHQTSAPPPNEKKLRKNELAANAMERPNTIWMRWRKPPLVSPKASVRPVMMMMITATILATGPCDGIENLLKRCLPWHAGAGSMRGA